MNEFFLSALSFGLAAGLKPGPLGVIVIQQTLSRGLPAGVRASLAPLITDGPIIIAALWFLSQFKSIDLFAAALSLVGGAYLLWLTVGGSYIIRGSTAESLVFVVTSIGTLIASKVAVAVLAVRFFPSLESRGYLLTMKFLAGTLVWFGLVCIVRAAELGLHYARD